MTAQIAPTTAPNGTSRTILFIGGAVVALIAVAIVVVLAAGGRTAQEIASDAPEGAIQRYLIALDDGEYEAAYAYFSDDVQTAMTLEDFELAIDSYAGYVGEGSPARQVSLDRVSGDGDTVVAHLVVEEFSGDGLNGNSYRSEREIRLMRQSDGWRIDEPLVWLDPAPSFEFGT